MALDSGGVWGGDSSGCVLTAEFIKSADGLDARCGRKRRKDNSSNNNKENETACGVYYLSH